MLLLGPQVLRSFGVVIVEGIFVDAGVLEADLVVGLDEIWRVAGVSTSGWDSSPSDSLLAVLLLELGSVSISSSSLLEVSELILSASTCLASCCYCFFRSISAICMFICL